MGWHPPIFFSNSYLDIGEVGNNDKILYFLSHDLSHQYIDHIQTLNGFK